MNVIRMLPLLILLATNPAPAQTSDQATGLPPVEMEQTDANKDGSIDRQEFEHRIIEIFQSADKDGDQRLSMPELGNVNEKVFQRADENKNRQLNIKEYVHFRFADFDRIDQDKDNLITPGELRNW